MKFSVVLVVIKVFPFVVPYKTCSGSNLRSRSLAFLGYTDKSHLQTVISWAEIQCSRLQEEVCVTVPPLLLKWKSSARKKKGGLV